MPQKRYRQFLLRFNCLFEYLLSRNIQVRPIWKPVHTLAMYRDCQASKIESTMDIYHAAINLPCSVNLKDRDIKYVVENIKDFFKGEHHGSA